MLVEDALNIYVDGSSLPTPRRGGVGMVFAAVDSHAQTIFEEEDSPLAYPGPSFEDRGARGFSIRNRQLPSRALLAEKYQLMQLTCTPETTLVVSTGTTVMQLSNVPIRNCEAAIIVGENSITFGRNCGGLRAKK